MFINYMIYIKHLDSIMNVYICSLLIKLIIDCLLLEVVLLILVIKRGLVVIVIVVIVIVIVVFGVDLEYK
jgi:hypothetical protein